MTGGNKKLFLTLALLFIGASVWFYLRGGDGITLDFGETRLTVHGPEQYAFAVDYADIRSLALVDAPDYGAAAGGKSKGGFSYGAWRNAAWGDYALCVTNRAKRCIVLTTESGAFAFNYENDASTEQLYQAFLKLLEDRENAV